MKLTQTIYTLNIIEVTAYLKGYHTNHEIGIITYGGTLYDKAVVVTPSADLAAYNEYLFFLDNDNIVFDNKTYRANHPNTIQATLYSSVQGAMTKQLGFYHDLHSEPKQTELSLCNKILQWTKTTMKTPEGRTFVARDGDTRPLWSSNNSRFSSITSFSPNPTNGGTTEASDYITISGSGFGATEDFVYYANASDGGATLTTSSITSDNLSWSDTEVQNKTPQNAGTGAIRVNGITSGSNLTVNYAHTAINNDFASWSESTRQRPFLVDKNSSGGYTFEYNTTFNANTSATAAFERALDSWKNGTGVNITISGTATATSSVASDGVNVVVFNASLPAGVFGRGTTRFNATASASCLQANTVWWIDEMDIEFQTTPSGCCTWNYGTGASLVTQYDFETVALHELGHCFGLRHVIEPSQVMHYAIVNGTDIRTLSTNDKNGLTAKLAYSDDPLCMTPSGVNGPHVPTAVLPVELMDFKGQAMETGSLLTWKTASEKNNSHFEIEWSNSNDFHFKKIGIIQGAGTTNEFHPDSYRDYEFLHKNPSSGTNYYRLKQVDLPVRQAGLPTGQAGFDGQFEYSKVISVKNKNKNKNKNNTFQILPNPARDYLEIKTNQNGRCQIIDISGKILIEKDISNSNKIDVSDLSNGIYFINMNGITKKLVVQK